MKFVALVSGGKDSIYTICKLKDEGHTLCGLIYMKSTHEYSDSYMYQTVGSEIAMKLGECFGVPLYVFETSCNPINQNLEYEDTKNDEVEDLERAISSVLEKEKFEGISSGAIMSTYQKNRVEHICNKLGLKSLAPLWKKNQKDLLLEMIKYGISAIIVKVASSIFNKECLGMNLSEIYKHIDNSKSRYELNYCGEGGEYETAVLDCKYFIKRINVKSKELCAHPDEKEKEDGVYFLKFNDIILENKI